VCVCVCVCASARARARTSTCMRGAAPSVVFGGACVSEDGRGQSWVRGGVLCLQCGPLPANLRNRRHFWHTTKGHSVFLTTYWYPVADRGARVMPRWKVPPVCHISIQPGVWRLFMPPGCQGSRQSPALPIGRRVQIPCRLKCYSAQLLKDYRLNEIRFSTSTAARRP
jgi:hypothetical protein